MPQQVLSSVENNFTKGLITEATGLNFPENAATMASNCEFTLIGDVSRRLGINFEANGTTQAINRANTAMSSYVWNTPGGDGNSKLYVRQVGGTLYFYNIAIDTNTTPLSSNFISNGSVNFSGFSSTGLLFDATKECSYADGNGYLIVTHPSCDPFYVAYDPVNIVFTPNIINVQIRDFVGCYEPQYQGANANIRVNPGLLNGIHLYNLQNQGWLQGNNWSSTSGTSYTLGTTGSFSFTIAAGLSGPSAGQVVTIVYNGATFNTGRVTIPTGALVGSGTVTSYTSGSGILVVNITGTQYPQLVGLNISASSWFINPVTLGPMTTFAADVGLYPSNADVWWYFKDSSGTFNPTSTVNNVTLASGNAPQGHYILNAFNQGKAAIAGQPSLNNVTTTARPATCAWYAGRAWYSGVNGSQQANNTSNFYNWSEDIYFSQICVNNPSVLGNCFQNNDPTAEEFFSLLPDDGGVITIYGSGTIHKLWPTQNGLLVFANNGVWFITGSQGIGFTADDYTVTKISAVKVLSSRSFVDVLGLPYFWNEEGIYQVMATQTGSLAVEPLTVGTILTFYNNIPLSSKKYARGDYDPINYTIQWCYKSLEESSVTDRYQFDSILNYNTFNKAFYPYSISTGSLTQYIHDVKYVSYPFIQNSTPNPDFKYACSQVTAGSYQLGFAEEYDTSYLDWGMVNYTSTFATGYKLHGQAWKKFQAPYVYVYSRNNGYGAYYIQALWDYAINFDSNKWSQPQFAEVNDSNSSMFMKRHKIRGRGRALQLQFSSVQGQPFDIMGWAMYENVNASV
jgi:hypothetical protein